MLYTFFIYIWRASFFTAAEGWGQTLIFPLVNRVVLCRPSCWFFCGGLTLDFMFSDFYPFSTPKVDFFNTVQMPFFNAVFSPLGLWFVKGIRLVSVIPFLQLCKWGSWACASAPLPQSGRNVQPCIYLPLKEKNSVGEAQRSKIPTHRYGAKKKLRPQNLGSVFLALTHWLQSKHRTCI